MAGQLALIPVAAAPEKQVEGDLISLPYIDEVSQEETMLVERLLQEEAWPGLAVHTLVLHIRLNAAGLQAARGSKQPLDYLKELPTLPPLKFQASWGRAAARATQAEH